MAERGHEVLKVVDQAEVTQPPPSKSDDWFDLKPRLCHLRHVFRLIRESLPCRSDASCYASIP
jgi:hypothetical protein